ncbi:unnamed protein product [Bodo saltans]|uniref:Membrane-associated protein n=1 Tax=Bodo saltans TaxID=75058 RepID=A0A0S4J0D4_BODSA|nr:unnamed protein product [Bodo saltans]|eukprot:CUG74335.1 unnamed protein product [Bodo saltans]
MGWAFFFCLCCFLFTCISVFAGTTLQILLELIPPWFSICGSPPNRSHFFKTDSLWPPCREWLSYIPREANSVNSDDETFRVFSCTISPNYINSFLC